MRLEYLQACWDKSARLVAYPRTDISIHLCWNVFFLFLGTFSFGTGRGRGDLKNFLFSSEYQFGSEVQSDRRPSILFSAFLQQIFHWRYFGILKLFGSSCTPVKIGIPFCLCDLKVLAFQCTLKISLSNGTFFIMTIIILGHNFLKGCLVEF